MGGFQVDEMNLIILNSRRSFCLQGTSRNGDPHIVEETAGHMYGMQVTSIKT